MKKLLPLIIVFIVGMCGMDFSSSVWFWFGFEKNRGFGFGSVLKNRWFGFLCRSVVK